MGTLIYWFRNDLRLADNPAFTQACLNADYLLPVYVHDTKEQETVYGFERQGPHRQAFLRASLDDLGSQCSIPRQADIPKVLFSAFAR